MTVAMQASTNHEPLSAYGAEGDKSPPRKPLKREKPAKPADGPQAPAPGGAAEPPASGS
jgi:hypothetical protein